MTTQEAKFILQAYRPGGEDANDPQFAEALSQLKNDPELAKWFAEQLAFDSVMSRALKQLKPPDDLRESILSGGRVIAPAFSSRRVFWWAAAAAVALTLCLSALWLNSVRFGAYVDKMAAASTSSENHVDVKISNFGDVEAWLANRGMNTNFMLPVSLSGAPATGCRILNWHGHKISMLCYMLDGPRHYDLFVAERSDFMFAPAGGLNFGKTKGLATAVWTKADKVYLMIAHTDEVILRKDLEAGNTAQQKLEAEIFPYLNVSSKPTEAQLFESLPGISSVRKNIWNKTPIVVSCYCSYRDVAPAA